MIRMTATFGDVTVTRYMGRNPIVAELWETEGQDIFDKQIVRHDEYFTQYGAIIKIGDLTICLSREEFSCLQKASVQLAGEEIDNAIDMRIEDLDMWEESND